MPADTTLSKVNTVDFFAVVVPGTYLLANLALFGFVFVDTTVQTSSWEIIWNAISSLNPYSLLLVLLVAYLLGSTARAIPVKVVDDISSKNHRIIRAIRGR